MKIGQKLWTREELILAINLYCKLPFGRLHYRNPEIIKLANLINRTPGSVAFKLVNFASLDPSLKARGIKGAVNASKLDKKVWNEFYNNWDVLPYESEKLLAEFKNTTVEKLNHIDESDIPKSGITREQLIKVRVNQSFFRSMILAGYNSTCCVTGMNNSKLLVAGHIVPWAKDELNRLNPRNGLCLNALHDKAFENGLITITTKYKIRVSKELKKSSDEIVKKYFSVYDNQEMIAPSRFLPDKQFLEYHNEKFKEQY